MSRLAVVFLLALPLLAVCTERALDVPQDGGVASDAAVAALRGDAMSCVPSCGGCGIPDGCGRWCGHDCWVALPPMRTGRALHGVAAGLDGRIYAVGGVTIPGGELRTVEAYTPSTASWAYVASMHSAHDGVSAVTTLDGRILAIGGLELGTSAGLVEAYTPAVNTWLQRAPLPGSAGVVAAIVGDTVFSIDIDHWLTYSVSQNVWTTGATAPPTYRGYFGFAAGADGRIYTIGGVTATPVSTVEAYVPATQQWKTLTPLPSPRFGAVAVSGPDGRIYLLGGLTSLDGTAVAKVDSYSPSADSWMSVAPMLTPRNGFAAATGADGRIYAVGGVTGTGITDAEGGIPMNSVEAYIP